MYCLCMRLFNNAIKTQIHLDMLNKMYGGAIYLHIYMKKTKTSSFGKMTSEILFI